MCAYMNAGMSLHLCILSSCKNSNLSIKPGQPDAELKTNPLIIAHRLDQMFAHAACVWQQLSSAHLQIHCFMLWFSLPGNDRNVKQELRIDQVWSHLVNFPGLNVATTATQTYSVWWLWVYTGCWNQHHYATFPKKHTDWAHLLFTWPKQMFLSQKQQLDCRAL